MKNILKKLFPDNSSHSAKLIFIYPLIFFLFILWITPLVIFNTEPATGGDTASHFYPLYTLFNYGFPQGVLRVWNPGNLMGEPHLLHYFPGPYLLMAFLGLIMPLGLAFNIGTILPVFAFPVSLFFGLYLMRRSLPQCLIATAASLIFLFNEGYSMWGGNALSLLAGQFAHLYAVNFLFLLLGAIAWELRQEGREFKFTPWLLMLITICHTYILLLVPFFFLSFIAVDSLKVSKKIPLIKERLRYFVILGFWGLLLSMWFIIPQILNSAWMTANPMKWYFDDPVKQITPYSVWPVWGSILVVLPVLTYFAGAKKLAGKEIFLEFIFWFLPILACLGMFFVFPKLGLVDARVIPQIQLFVALIGALFFARGLELLQKKELMIGLTVLTVVASLFWTYKNISNYPNWVRWNYNSWYPKKTFPEILSLSAALSGSFSEARVANEHNPSLNDAGTTRVFESLPIFAHRASMESLYQEAAFTAPLTYYLQARISKQPSCPIRGWDCPTMDFQNLTPILNILGVKDLILTSEDAFNLVKLNPDLELKHETSSFQVWTLKKEPSLVEMVFQNPRKLVSHDFRRSFYGWLRDYTGQEPLLINDAETFPLANATMNCAPKITADYNKISLDTNCPGYLHLLKFTYHPTWKASSGDRIYLASPGFMALVPSQSHIDFRFGQSSQWVVAWVISALAALMWLAYIFKFIKPKKG